MDGQYELSGDDRFDGLLFGLDRLAKSADYHMSLRPEQATEVITRRQAEEDKKLAVQAAKEAKANAEKLKKGQEPAQKGENA
jgi:hypothetical protein